MLMKMVLTHAQVAKALEISSADLHDLLPQLYCEGFPRPIKVLSSRWSLIEVMNWVNKQSSAEADNAAAGALPGMHLVH
jgi:predicted DNA-binding transcriptional regulator AlpA